MSNPPFTITSAIVTSLTAIATILGQYTGLRSPAPQPQLRKQNRIRTVQGTLAIEGNTLSQDQITAIVEGRRVAGPQREILEVVNALNVYDAASKLNPLKMKDLLRCHSMMMAGLLVGAGKFRTTNVGVIKGTKVTHVAPKAVRVPALMRDLFAFLKNDTETPTLVKACVFHYELEFIHPFTDGNGRLGRFWQHLIALKEHPLFATVPVESLIKIKQREYYQALRESDKRGDSTKFIEFSLEILRQGLEDVVRDLQPSRLTPTDRLTTAMALFAGKTFTRKEYRKMFEPISTATASRDLALGVAMGWLHRRGDKAEAVYHGK